MLNAYRYNLITDPYLDLYSMVLYFDDDQSNLFPQQWIERDEFIIRIFKIMSQQIISVLKLVPNLYRFWNWFQTRADY